MDANTYFANQYLGEVEDAQRRAEQDAELAKEMIEDEESEFYPWHPDQIREAICEISDLHLRTLANARISDKAMAMQLREIVVGYWLRQAEIDLEGRSID